MASSDEPGCRKLKLTGDGTNIARNLHVVNVAFTVLNDTLLVSFPFGNHSLAILKVPEDYTSLSDSLADIIEEAQELKSIEIDGSVHQMGVIWVET